jgi:hypothetical protein
MSRKAALFRGATIPFLLASHAAVADSNMNFNAGNGNQVQIECHGACNASQMAAAASSVQFATGSSNNHVQVQTQAGDTLAPITVNGTNNQVQINQQKGTGNSTASISVGGANNHVQIQQQGSNNSTAQITDV